MDSSQINSSLALVARSLACFANTNAQKFVTVTVMLAIVAKVSLLPRQKVLASILHFGHKGTAVLGVNWLLTEIGVDGDRINQRMPAVTFLVISVINRKVFAECFQFLVKRSLGVCRLLTRFHGTGPPFYTKIGSAILP